MVKKIDVQEGGLTYSVVLDGVAAALLADLDGGAIDDAVTVACIRFLQFYQSEYMAQEFQGPTNNSSGGRVKGGGGVWKKLKHSYRKWKLDAVERGLLIKTTKGLKRVQNPAPMGVLTGSLRDAVLDPASVKTFGTAGAILEVTANMVAHVKYFDAVRPVFRVLQKDLAASRGGKLKTEFERIVLDEIGELIGAENLGSTGAYVGRDG